MKSEIGKQKERNRKVKMKIILPILMVFVAGCYGFPRHFNFNAYADFVPCRDANAIQTLWPDFNNNRVFRQCITVGVYGVHNCPANLLFSFWDQVCVWERDWRAPPAPDQITPFPTTQWPRQSTATQEVTVSTDQPLTTPDVTTPPAGDSTTTHAEGDLTTTSLGDLTTLQEITLPENPDLTPPEVEATTNLTVKY